MKSIQKGFTLIELMIVVAIIAILAAIAISQYQDYVIRSQVSEGSSLADGMKSAYVEYINIHDANPPSNASAGLASPSSIAGNYVSSVTVANGPIVVTYANNGTQQANAKIDGKTLIFSPVTRAGSVAWVCRSSSLVQKWCPSSCSCNG